jgi:hypothetical protein
MQKLKRIRRQPFFRREFSDQEMLAYFTQNNTKKMRVLLISTLLGLLLPLLADLSLFFYPTIYYLVFLALGALCALVALTVWLMLLFGIRPPTDEEFDVWVQSKAREHLRGILHKARLERLSDEEVDNMIFIRGFVLKGTSNAKQYRDRDIHWKKGKDNVQRYSINVFRYFYPNKNQLSVFIIDVNAVNQRDHREVLHKYFFADVVAVTVVYEHNLFEYRSDSYNYLTQSFMLRISDGFPISATILSRPLDDGEKLVEYRLPDSDNVEAMIDKLSWLIESHKHNPALGAGLSDAADDEDEDEDETEELDISLLAP